MIFKHAVEKNQEILEGELGLVLNRTHVLTASGDGCLLSASARLAQSAERKALNFVVVGSSPTVGVLSVMEQLV